MCSRLVELEPKVRTGVRRHRCHATLVNEPNPTVRSGGNRPDNSVTLGGLWPQGDRTRRLHRTEYTVATCIALGEPYVSVGPDRYSGDRTLNSSLEDRYGSVCRDLADRASQNYS